jgi:hypothetical protein
MLEKNKAQTTREVNIRGHGPEASRAGRPWPMSEADRLALARSAVGKKRAQEVDLQRKRSTNESILNGHRTSFRKRHVLDDGGPKQSLQVPEMEGDTKFPRRNRQIYLQIDLQKVEHNAKNGLNRGDIRR